METINRIIFATWVTLTILGLCAIPVILYARHIA